MALGADAAVVSPVEISALLVATVVFTESRVADVGFWGAISVGAGEAEALGSATAGSRRFGEDGFSLFRTCFGGGLEREWTGDFGSAATGACTMRASIGGVEEGGTSYCGARNANRITCSNKDAINAHLSAGGMEV